MTEKKLMYVCIIGVLKKGPTSIVDTSQDKNDGLKTTELNNSILEDLEPTYSALDSHSIQDH